LEGQGCAESGLAIKKGEGGRSDNIVGGKMEREIEREG